MGALNAFGRHNYGPVSLAEPAGLVHRTRKNNKSFTTIAIIMLTSLSFLAVVSG